MVKYLPGVTPEDFRLLFRLRLIEPIGASPSSEATAQPPATDLQAKAGVAMDPAAALRMRQLALALSRMVSTHLGLAGTALTSSIARAATVEELLHLARQVLGEIKACKGEQMAADALKELRGLI